MTQLAVDYGAALPCSWATAAIQEVAEISPKVDVSNEDDDRSVHFVPMAAVAEDFGGLDASQLRPLRDVRKGYTAFQEGDVLFAKITPCMENGKGAIVPKLPHDYAFGSTEFHVLRPGDAISEKWLSYYLSQPDFRRVARQSMTGTAGQLRVPAKWLSWAGVPVPPRAEQSRIVEKLEELLSDLDTGVAELRAAQRKLAQYRQSLLKAAVEGALTTDWRAAQGKPKETGAELLQRILAERRVRWEQKQLAKFAEQGKAPSKDWQAKYPEPVAPEATGLPQLPDGWIWTTVDQLASVGTGVTPLRSNRNYFEGGDIPWTTSGALNDEVVSTPSAYVTQVAASECRLDLYPAGTLLVAMYGEGRTRGKCAELAFTSTINQAIAAISFEGSSLSMKPYVKTFFLDSYEAMRKQASGGVQPNLNLQIIKGLLVPLAPLAEQVQIQCVLEEQLGQFRAMTESATTSIRQAEAQRKNLLKAAFSGQLVPQDPNDEPASALLARIRAGRESGATTTAKKRGRKAKERA